MEDRYVIFWYFDGVGGEQHYETFDTLNDAQTALTSYAECYPWNSYYLAKIVGHQPATAERPARLGVSLSGSLSSGAGAICTVENGTITAVTLTNYGKVHD